MSTLTKNDQLHSIVQYQKNFPFYCIYCHDLFTDGKSVIPQNLLYIIKKKSIVCYELRTFQMEMKWIRAWGNRE